ncbi:MAG: RecQ family ATP-dependent DNA helicase [Victivallaceae bacterium]|nr:RecQ family ATP-dependent DNA helicase [Victivallaceae bacterium]
MNAKEALQKYFGYQEFLDNQQEVVDAVLSGDDILVVMPTGAGKSLCYQLPMMICEGYGIVASPLIALMQDQVGSLQSRGLPAAFINSTIDIQEQRDIMRRVLDGEIKLLYVAPERFDAPVFRRFLYNNPPSMLVVDEAHCISQWGHDFRPAYRRIGCVADEFGIRQVCAFTATATEHVRQDITEQLHRPEMKLMVAGFKRPNLSFRVLSCRTEHEKIDEIKNMLKVPAPTIIYAATRQAVDKLAGELGVIAYHAGMSDEDRLKSQNAFMTEKTPVLVATNAFGMGIDRPDIRRVVHFQMPGSLEALYQEAGRAGRDGESAECTLLFNYSDRYVQEFLIETNNPPSSSVRAVYDALKRYAAKTDTKVMELKMSDIRAMVPSIKSDGQVVSSLSALEQAGAITRGTAKSRMSLKFLQKPSSLAVTYQGEENQRARFIHRMALRFGADLLKTTAYDLDFLCEVSSLGPDQVKRVLVALNGSILEFERLFGGRSIMLVDTDRTDPGIEAGALDAKYDREMSRLKDVISYAESPQNLCRQAVLVSYFGEDVSGWECRCCDHCDSAAANRRAPTGGEKEQLRTILIAVKYFRGHIGSVKLAKILSGSRTADIMMPRFRRSPCYGVLHRLKQADIIAEIDALRKAGMIEKVDNGGYPCITITECGEECLETREFPALDMSSPSPVEIESVRPSGELLEAMKQLRNSIAADRGVIPYEIFGNATLEDLVKAMPETAEDAMGIRGIGAFKAKRYLPAFLELIRLYRENGGK